MYTNLNSIHKHPGSSTKQGFSGTDLKKDHTTDTGIVFPLSSAENDKPNFAGIMAHDRDVNHVAHFEYRTVNGKVDISTKGEIVYTKSRCISYVKDKLTKLSSVEKLLGLVPESTSYYKTSNAEVYPIIKAITAIWDKHDFEPATQFISPDNVSKKTYVYPQFPNYAYSQYVGKGSQSVPTITDKYITECETIDWKTEEELTASSSKVVFSETLTIAQIYFGPDAMSDLLDLSKEDLIEEYLDIQKFIYLEIADYKEQSGNLPIQQEISLERLMMENQLMNLGFTQKAVSAASLSHLAMWHESYVI